MNDARYEFHELIATGGMGEVWRATDTMLGRDVAIKLLKPEFADDPVNRARFDSEARHAAALHHPHVAAVYDVGEMPTASGLMRPYLVMELINGKPLAELLRDGRPLDPDVVRDLLGQAGDALAAAHRAGIVHRDVKPANMLVTPDGQVKVTDFGIARAAGNSAITGTGQVMGTPQYLSPEQARGERATAASDVYALGVVAFECLTGQRPFQKESPVATAISHLHDPVPPLPDSVPADLRTLVEKALSKDPQERYPDAAAFTAALRATGTGTAAAESVGDADAGATTQVIPAPAAAPATSVLPAVGGAGAAAAAAADEDADATPDTPAEREEKRRNPLLTALLVLLLLAAVGLIAWLLLGGGDEEEPDPAPPPATSSAASREPSPTQEQTTREPETITLDESDYLGRDIDAVLADLRGLGLAPSSEARDNDGSEEPDTVSDVFPLEGLAPGDLVTVTYWGPAPQEPDTQDPQQDPEPTDEPTEPADEPTDEPTTDEPTDDATTEQPGAESSSPAAREPSEIDPGLPGEGTQP